jgi:hypothetical protein
MGRREFLGAVGAATAGGLMTTPAQAETPEKPPEAPTMNSIHNHPKVVTPEGKERLSSLGREKIEDINRRYPQQRQHSYGRKINAVKDLGLDPSGKEPIDGKLTSANLDNARVFFPKGNYRVTGDMTFRTDAPCALVGPKATLKMDTGARGHLRPIIPGGLIKGLSLDLSADGALFGLQPMTDGYVEVKNVDIVGYAAPIPETESSFGAMYVPIAKTSDAAIRAVGLSAVGGTAADMHDDGSPPSAPENQMRTYSGVWVGSQNKGTIQLIDAQIRGWQNGIYGGRTPGEVHILGGTWWNNSNCQIRIGGGSFADRVKIVIDDRKWSMKQNPGPYSLGEQQGVNGIRIETGGRKGVQDEPVHLRNLKIRGLSVRTIAALINMEGTSPMTKVKNCVLENHIGVPAVLAARPGSQFNYPAAPNPTVQIVDSLVEGGKMDPAILAHDRPGRVLGTCLSYPGAGPEDIVGLDIGQTVSFGKCGPKSGLSAPKKVASGVNVSNLPIPTGGSPSYSSSGGPTGRQGPSKGVLVAVVSGIFVLLLIFGMVGLFIAGIMGALGSVAGLIAGD